MSRKIEMLLALYVGGCWLGFAADLKAPTAIMLWILPVTALLYAASALVWVHRVSEIRYVWRKGARFWLWPLLPVATALALSVAWILRPARAAHSERRRCSPGWPSG